MDYTFSQGIGPYAAEVNYLRRENAVLKAKVANHEATIKSLNEATIKSLKAALEENGPGLRAQRGRYTEPGEPIVCCDNGYDE